MIPGFVFAGCWDRKVLKFCLETGDIVQRFGPVGSHEQPITSLFVMNVKAHDEHGLEDIRAYSGSMDQRVLVWNANKGQGDQRGFMRAITGPTAQAYHYVPFN